MLKQQFTLVFFKIPNGQNKLEAADPTNAQQTAGLSKTMSRTSQENQKAVRTEDSSGKHRSSCTGSLGSRQLHTQPGSCCTTLAVE